MVARSPKCGCNRNLGKNWHNDGAFKVCRGNFFVTILPTHWRNAPHLLIECFSYLGISILIYAPMMKISLALKVTWPMFSCIFWRVPTRESLLFIRTFHLGELHICLGGDLGGLLAYFEELLVDLHMWSPLKAMCWTFHSTFSFFDGYVPLFATYSCWKLVHVAWPLHCFMYDWIISWRKQG